MSKRATFLVSFGCPHCGHKNELQFALYAPLRVVTCDLDSGGCDQDFVVDPQIRVISDPIVCRIEGIGRPVDRTADTEDYGW